MSGSEKNINKISYNVTSTPIRDSSTDQKKKIKKKCTTMSFNASTKVAQQQAESVRCGGKKYDRNEGTDELNHNDVKIKSGIDCIDELFSKKRELKMKQQFTGTSSDCSNNDDDIHLAKKATSTKKRRLLHGDRSDLERLQSGEWVDDGLGGKFNSDGFTGRRDEQSGYKVYKAHLLNKKGFGSTTQCPFDCDCCFI